MDTNLLKSKIKDLRELSKTMDDNINNPVLLKYFTGELSLLTKEITTIIST